MRVLLTTDAVGGVWTFTRELTEQLLAEGHSVALVSFGRAPSPMQRAWVDGVMAANRDFLFRDCGAPLEWMQENSFAWAEGAGLLTDLAAEFQADILHSNQFCWGALPLDVPKLITAHSDVLSWAAACRKNLTPSPWLDRYRSLVQYGLDGTDAMVAPTDWMREALRMHFKVGAPFFVVPNGRTVPGPGSGRERKLQAVAVGRLWDEGKGLAILSEIVSPVPVLLAGESSFAGAAGRDLPGNVMQLGTLDETSLFDFFSASSIYLATSLYEPFGLAPLEAALCGCAIVARDMPSFREVWEDAALYFKDAVGLQSILNELARDPGKLHRMRAAAADRARFFTAKRMGQGYVSLYSELMTGASILEEELHAA